LKNLPLNLNSSFSTNIVTSNEITSLRTSWNDVNKELLTFLDESSDEHIFGWGFERDEVHAVLAANVSALQPIDLIINFTKLYGD